MEGIITKGIGGQYEVKVTSDCDVKGERVICTARGGIRNKKLTPAIGDMVNIELSGDPDVPYVIQKIMPRKNILVRPPVANVSTIILTFACRDPEPDLKLLDKMLIVTSKLGIKPVIVFTKGDLAREECQMLYDTYRKAGYDVYMSSSDKLISVDELRPSLEHGIVGFAGPSGVGKSTALNSILEGDHMETGEISSRLKRGKHTTRHVQLFDFGEDYIVDTPGFTSLSLYELGIEYGDVILGYPEIKKLSEGCRFDDCRHINETNCAVRGNIDEGRYERYKEFYEELYQLRNTYVGRLKK